MKITNITPQKKNKNFYNIFVDDEFFCSLDDESIYHMKLKIGIEINEDALKKASAESAYKKALNYSLNLLGRYYKTKQELKKKLKEKEYESDIIAAVIEKLEDLGYLNDENYAEAFVRSKKETSQGLNRKTLYNKMLMKGLDRELIQESLEKADIDEYENALKAAEKKLKNLKGNKHEKKAKLYSYLYSKGFDYETCSKVLNNIEITE